MALGNKHGFWQALIVALVIFWTGILLGAYFEGARADELRKFYLDSESDIFDIELQDELLELGMGCGFAVSESIRFADRIYYEARELEKYDASTKITDDVLALHKRYDLLRTMLWTNLIKSQAKCGRKVNTVIYLYDYLETPIAVQSQQAAISRVLSELKEAQGDNVILIPIAVDTGVRSLELLRAKYGISSVPSVIINEKFVLEGLISGAELEGYLR